MSYNKTTGFLRVPVSGYYNVYSQVLLEPSNISSAKMFGHYTSSCTCPDHNTNCQCSLLETGVGYIADKTQKNLLASTTFNTRAQSNYHGGVFHLEAGTYLGILVNLKSNPQASVKFNTYFENSFIGAFLISEDTPPHPTPSAATMSTTPTPTPSCTCL